VGLIDLLSGVFSSPPRPASLSVFTPRKGRKKVLHYPVFSLNNDVSYFQDFLFYLKCTLIKDNDHALIKLNLFNHTMVVRHSLGNFLHRNI